MSLFIIVSIATSWTVWALKTVQTNFITKLNLKMKNQAEFMRHKTQHYLEWHVMEWISSLRISVHPLTWKYQIGCVSQVWEPIPMDPEVYSTEWKALIRFWDGTLKFILKNSWLNNNIKLENSVFEQTISLIFYILVFYIVNSSSFVNRLKNILKNINWFSSSFFWNIFILSINDLNPAFSHFIRILERLNNLRFDMLRFSI